MSRNYKQLCKFLNYFDTFFLATAVTGGISISYFASLLGNSVEITSSAIG